MATQSENFLYEEGMLAVTRDEPTVGIMDPYEADFFHQGVLDGISIKNALEDI